MAIQNASYSRDANRVPITTDGITITDSQSLVASNTTAAVPIFRVTGNIEVRGLWGIVTTVLSSNITAAYWRLNDQTAQVDITLNTGTVLSSAAAGSSIVKKGLAAAALTLNNASAGRISEPTTLETPYFSPFVMTQKTGAVQTDIEFRYTTTNTPATGAIQFFLRYLPLSADANVAAV
jgi:hypothetical protein